MKFCLPGNRNRLIYCLILGSVIVAGLLSRSGFAVHLPVSISTYAGDTLWTIACYLTICILFPRIKIKMVALISLAVSFSVEFSQLFKAVWIDTLRSNRIGALFLGSGFLWSDLLCYTTGCILGIAADVLMSVKEEN